MNHLLHPEFFDGIPATGQFMARKIQNWAAKVAMTGPPLNMTVAIRAYNEAPMLERLLADVARQKHVGRVEIVVVDNESNDNTTDVARDFGAKIITLPRNEFSYPKSMNLAVEAATNDIVFLTVAHSCLSHDAFLARGAEHFRVAHDNVGGAFSYALTDNRGSRTERTATALLATKMRQQEITRPGMGTMGAGGVFLRRSIWDALGRYDERYQSGGEDGALAKKIAAAGYKIIYDPSLSIHHAHGLGPINSAKQFYQWWRTGSPQTLDLEALHKRRPDLRSKL